MKELTETELISMSCTQKKMRSGNSACDFPIIFLRSWHFEPYFPRNFFLIKKHIFTIKQNKRRLGWEKIDLITALNKSNILAAMLLRSEVTNLSSDISTNVYRHCYVC